jgi:hypothetical protein
MIDIKVKVSEVLGKGFKPFPNSNDRYWDMGTIHQESIILINSLLKELALIVKTKHNLELNIDDLIKENYEF